MPILGSYKAKKNEKNNLGNIGKIDEKSIFAIFQIFIENLPKIIFPFFCIFRPDFGITFFA